jgi:hypothetical protein
MYMLALSKDRELSARWQRAAQSLLAEAHIAPLSKQIALALFHEGKLVLAAWRRERNSRTGVDMWDNAGENIIEHLAGASP